MSTPPLMPQAERATYPALLPREIIVLRAWLRLHEPEYTSFDYNVRVGPGFDPGPSVPQYIRDMSIKNTRKRIDALAWAGSQPTIIEVKDRAGLSAVGQLMGYIVHWKREHPHDVPPKALLVANRLAPGVGDVLQAHNIPFELVGV